MDVPLCIHTITEDTLIHRRRNLLLFLGLLATVLWLITIFHNPTSPQILHLKKDIRSSKQPDRQNNTVCLEAFRKTHLMTVLPLGRLGNNLFQLMTLLSVSKSLCYTPVLEAHMKTHLGHLLNLSHLATKDTEVSWRSVSEKSPLSYWQGIEQLNSTYNWQLRGYFQSWKYFQRHEKYLRETLRFPKLLLTRAENVFAKCRLSRENVTVGVHVRLQDTLSNKVRESGIVVPNMAYITKAMDYFKRKYPHDIVSFIVVTDDMNWCKSQSWGDHVFFSDLSTAEEDFVLLTQCRHIVMTVGTFGWMAAWFSGGEAVYFKGSFRPGSPYGRLLKADDYYLPHWVGL